MTEPTASLAGKATLSAILHALAQDESRDRIAVRDLLAALGDRALPALLFVFAVPNVLRVPPGTSAILGAPLVLLAALLAFGRRPWLPVVMAQRTMTRWNFALLVSRIGPWLARTERLLRSRMVRLALPPMEYLVGLVCLLLRVGGRRPYRSATCCRRWLSACWPWVCWSGTACGFGRPRLVAAATTVVVASGVVFAMVKAGAYFFAELLRRNHPQRQHRVTFGEAVSQLQSWTSLSPGFTQGQRMRLNPAR